MAAPLAPSWDGGDDGAYSHATLTPHIHTHRHTGHTHTTHRIHTSHTYTPHRKHTHHIAHTHHSHTLTLTQVLAHGSAEFRPSLPLLSPPPHSPVSSTPQAPHKGCSSHKRFQTRLCPGSWRALGPALALARWGSSCWGLGADLQ